MTAITTTESVSNKTISREQQDVFAARKNVLCIRDLRKTFGGQVVLDGATADLREGEVVLLRGNNGSGKTTLLNILSGNLEPDDGSIHLQVNGASEYFNFPRRWWENLNPFDHFTPERVAREGVGRTWQDVRLFNTLTLAENIAVASPRQVGENPLNILLRHRRMRLEERCNREATSNRLRELGLGDRENSSADRISLGQSKRVAIARAIQAGARILFLDEPLAGLDAQGIDYILELLRELVREHRVTLVIVEHVFNIPRVLDLADTVWTLSNGRIAIESAGPVRASGVDIGKTDIVSWFAKHLDFQGVPVRETLAGGAVLWKLQRSGFQKGDSESPLLEVSDLVVHRGKRLVLGEQRADETIRGISFSVKCNEAAVLQAPNGWGKSTLAEAIMGITPIQGGRIVVRGRQIETLSIWDRVKAGLQFLPSRNSEFSSLTLRDVMALTRVATDRQFVGIGDWRLVGSLSGGERQRVNIASIKPATVGIYDEPFSALDQSALSAFMNTEAVRGSQSMLVLLPQI